jgi:hypothetical protein
MRVRINRASHTTFFAATLLAGAAWLVVPAALAPVSAEEGQTSREAPQAEAPAQVAPAQVAPAQVAPAQEEAPAKEAPAKEAETGGHGGMHGGMMGGGLHEGGMQGCKMMGGDHAGTTGEGMQGCKMMQGGMHEGGMQGGGMMGGDHSGMKHDDKDAMKDKPSGMGEMRKMMHEMMAEMAARADERLAKVKADLVITEAQFPQWNAFAEAVRTAARSMEQTHKEMTAAEAAARVATPKPAAVAPASEPTSGGATSYPGMGRQEDRAADAEAGKARGQPSRQARGPRKNADPAPRQPESDRGGSRPALCDLRRQAEGDCRRAEDRPHGRDVRASGHDDLGPLQSKVMNVIGPNPNVALQPGLVWSGLVFDRCQVR